MKGPSVHPLAVSKNPHLQGIRERVTHHRHLKASQSFRSYTPKYRRSDHGLPKSAKTSSHRRGTYFGMYKYEERYAEKERETAKKKRSNEEEEDPNVDVEGRMRVLNIKVDKIRDMQEKGSTELKKIQVEMESEVSAKMYTAFRVLQQVQKKME